MVAVSTTGSSRYTFSKDGRTDGRTDGRNEDGDSNKVDLLWDISFLLRDQVASHAVVVVIVCGKEDNATT